jgi:hypothetical protein
MRRVLILVLVIGGMFYFGWLTFSNSKEDSTIQINKTEIKADTEKAVEKVEEVIHEGVDAAKGAVESRSE